MFLQVKWRCKGQCAASSSWQSVTVLSRDAKQDVVEWTEYARREIANRHAVIAPSCQCRTCDMAIPLGSEERGTQADRIGGPTPDDDLECSIP